MSLELYAAYLVACIVVIMTNLDAVPSSFRAIIDGAFNPGAAYGGFIGVLVQGFRRAAFSNGLGKARAICLPIWRSDR